MKGNAEFLILFIPFFLIGLAAFYLALIYPIEQFVGDGLFLLGIKIIFGIIGAICWAIDIFALLVQYVNWKYYKE
jgi:hypothetical protein